MLKTSELIGAQLDYWTARAEGIPAEQLTIRRVQRSTDYHVAYEREPKWAFAAAVVLAYSTDWAQGGPLIEKHKIVPQCDPERGWIAYWSYAFVVWGIQGDTPLQAICRAVVRAAFGDEVEEVAVCS